MIKFFRHIRQRLLSENNFSKYLLYAIGEILLVIIGILIAIQVNNWNEERKADLSTNNTLIELKGSLLKDSTLFAANILEMENDLKIQKEVVQLLSQDKVLDSSIDDKLGKCMIIKRVIIAKNGFEKLKEFGLVNLKNKSLEIALIRYYDILYTVYKEQVEDDNYDFREIWLPYVRKNFKDYEYGNFAVPKDYLNLSKDDEFFIMLKINIFKRENTLNWLRYMQETNQRLLIEIKNHINQ